MMVQEHRVLKVLGKDQGKSKNSIKILRTASFKALLAPCCHCHVKCVDGSIILRVGQLEKRIAVFNLYKERGPFALRSAG